MKSQMQTHPSISPLNNNSLFKNKKILKNKFLIMIENYLQK